MCSYSTIIQIRCTIKYGHCSRLAKASSTEVVLSCVLDLPPSKCAVRIQMHMYEETTYDKPDKEQHNDRSKQGHSMWSPRTYASVFSRRIYWGEDQEHKKEPPQYC